MKKTCNSLFMLSIFLLTFPLLSCSFEKEDSTTKGTPALFNTKEEAEKAAERDFDCFGAHKMGNKWMPCEKHDSHTGHQHNH